MAEEGVPQTLPCATAALILGVSPQTFRSRYVQTGLVDVALVCSRGILITVTSLERAFGREITAKTYLIAERMRDKSRDYQRRFRDRETPALDHAAIEARPTRSVRPPTGRALRNLSYAAR